MLSSSRYFRLFMSRGFQWCLLWNQSSCNQSMLHKPMYQRWNMSSCWSKSFPMCLSNWFQWYSMRITCLWTKSMFIRWYLLDCWQCISMSMSTTIHWTHLRYFNQSLCFATLSQWWYLHSHKSNKYERFLSTFWKEIYSLFFLAYVCSCTPSFYGPCCEIRNFCIPNPW